MMSLLLYINSSSINIPKNPVLHSKKRRVSIKHHFLREKVSGEEAKLEYILANDQIANIFSKPFPANTFVYLRDKLGVSAPPDENEMQGVASIRWISEPYLFV